MNNPEISIITISYNSSLVIERTIESIKDLNFKKFEYIVVDGQSTDLTNKILYKYREMINVLIIEPDNGIYDAMNKAVRASSGRWLIFMNAGDIFYSPESLDGINLNDPLIDFYYSDTILSYKNIEVGKEAANINKHRFNHQSLLYKRSIHDKYGFYLNIKGLTISDYLLISPIWCEFNSKKLDRPIAMFDYGGISSNQAHFYQKTAVDLLYGFASPSKICFILMIYPIFNFYKKIRRMIFGNII